MLKYHCVTANRGFMIAEPNNCLTDILIVFTGRSNN